MAKKPSNQGKPWTSKDVSELDTLAKQNMPTRLIAFNWGGPSSKSEAKRYFAQIDRPTALWNGEVVKARKRLYEDRSDASGIL